MTDINVRLESTEEVILFNKIITRYPCDFDLEVGHNYVDAKSLLGIYSLSLNKPMILHIQADADMAKEIIDELEVYIYEENIK